MNKQRGFAPILAVLIMLILLGGGAYLYTKNKVQIPAPVPIVAAPTNVPTKVSMPVNPTPDKSPTADWKTYRNDKYGFEFKYPSNWQLSEGLNGRFVQVSETAAKTPEDEFNATSFSIIESISGAMLSIGGGTPGIISGKNMTQRDWFKDSPLKNYKKGVNVVISNDNAFHITMSTVDFGKEQILDQILQTLKFGS